MTPPGTPLRPNHRQSPSGRNKRPPNPYPQPLTRQILVLVVSPLRTNEKFLLGTFDGPEETDLEKWEALWAQCV